MAARTELDVIVSAQVQHQEQIAKLINDVGKLQAQMKKFADASGRVSVGVNKATTAINDQSKVMRQHRQGVQQAGMQVNDFFTSVSTGASPVQAFNQQIGQLGYALSMMKGRLGAVGGFLAGPWGGIITVATMGLGLLAQNFLKTTEETKKTTTAFERSEEAAREVQSAIAQLNLLHEEYRIMTAKTLEAESEIRKSLARTAKAALISADMQMEAAEKILDAEVAKLKAIKEETVDLIQTDIKYGKGQGAIGYLLLGNFKQQKQNSIIAKKAANAEAAFAEVSKKRAALQKRINDLTGLDIRISKEKTAEIKRATAAASRAERENEKRINEIEREQNSLDNLRSTLEGIITVRTAETTALGRAKKEYEDFQQLIDKIVTSTVNGKPAGAQILGELAPEIAAVTKSMKENINLIPFKEIDKQTKTFEDQLIKLQETDVGYAMLRERLMLAAEAYGLTGEQVAILQEKLAALDASHANIKIEERNAEMRDSFKSIGQSVSDAFKGMLTAGMSWKDGMKGIIQSVIDQLWKMYVVQKIVGLVTSAIGGGNPTGGGNPVSWFSKAATGGYPQMNKPVLVGERGPELFIPSASGKIVANHNLGTGGGGMVINVDARGSSDPAAVRAQVQQGILEAAPAIIAAAEQRTVSNMLRPRLGGAMQ